MACNACMTIPPVEDSYIPLGQTITTTDGLEVYIAAPKDSKTKAGLMYVPDIFGKTPQAFQVCDKLAAAGFWVAFPDAFRGKAWSLEKFPPPDRQELMEWIGGYPFEGRVKPDIACALALLRENGVERFGIVGFCWGGKMSTLSSQDAEVFRATASAHPSFVTVEDAALVNCPILLLPSKDEADLTPFIDAVKARGVEASQEKFDDMHHGWVAARGDWKDPKQQARATEAIQLFVSFFTKHLKGE